MAHFEYPYLIVLHPSTESYKMIKMHLKIQDIFIRPNEFLPDMSGGQTDFCEDCWLVYALGTLYM